jgi:Uma2 family endonuclease
MGEAALRMKMTEDEYLAFERASDERHEFADGEIFAMSSSTGVHSQVALSIAAELRVASRHCNGHAYLVNMRVYIANARSYVYPDAFVVCGRHEYKDASKDALLNPRVIFEVLSPSTEGYDRGDKFAQYRSIPSMSHYVLAAQDKPLLEVYTRQDDGSWNYRAYGPGEKAALPALGCELDVDVVYTDVLDVQPAEPASASVDTAAR